MGQAGYSFAWIAALFMAAIACAAAPARAQQDTVQLAWSVPDGSGCAAEEELRLLVERLSERAPFAAAGASTDFTIAGAIEPIETSWRARIVLRDAQGNELGQREVLGRSPTCRTLNVPVALVIVTLLDSLLDGPHSPATVESEPPLPPLPKPQVTGPFTIGAPASEHKSANAPHDGPATGGIEHTPLVLGLGAFAALDLSLLPSATPGFGAAVELRVPVPIAIEAAIYLPVEELDAQGRGAEFSLWHFGAAVCPELRISRGATLRAQLCGAGQLGAINAAGHGLTQAATAQRLVAVLGFEPKLVWFVNDALTARASILAGWVLARPSFRVDIEGQSPRILRSDPVALQLRVGVMGFAL
jgi:hypothetical protein